MKGRHFFVALFVFCAGCTARDAVQNVGRETPTQFGKLTRLKESHLAPLREELDRVEAERGLPLQAACEIEPQQTALAGLVAADRLPRLLKTADVYMLRFFPRALEASAANEAKTPAAPAPEPAEVQSLHSFLREQTALRRSIASYFETERLPAFQVPAAEGPLADLGFVGICRLGHCLLALDAAEQLTADHAAEATANLRTMLRMSQALAATPHPTPRLAAAEMRAQALELLAHVARHPATQVEALEAVRQALDDSLAHWPDDALAWRGDRACTLVTFELIAQGKLLSVIDNDDLVWLRKHDQLVPLLESENANWEHDVAFYLAAEREILAACDEPYYERREVFNQLDARLAQLENTVHFPRLSAELFLAHLEDGHRRQALDWARCEAWSLALSLAATSAPISSIATPINPLTGQPFILEGDGAQIVVRGIEAGDRDEIASVPLPPLAPVAERPSLKR